MRRTALPRQSVVTAYSPSAMFAGFITSWEGAFVTLPNGLLTTTELMWRFEAEPVRIWGTA